MALTVAWLAWVDVVVGGVKRAVNRARAPANVSARRSHMMITSSSQSSRLVPIRDAHQRRAPPSLTSSFLVWTTSTIGLLRIISISQMKSSAALLGVLVSRYKSASQACNRPPTSGISTSCYAMTDKVGLFSYHAMIISYHSDMTSGLPEISCESCQVTRQYPNLGNPWMLLHFSCHLHLLYSKAEQPRLAKVLVHVL